MCSEFAAFLSKTRRTASVLAAALSFTAGLLFSQENPIPVPSVRGGLHILSVSGYEVYYSNGLPNTTAAQPGAANLPSDLGVGASAVLNWTRFTDRSSFSLVYTPSYEARARYTTLDALNHSLSMNANRRLAPRWTFTFAFSGDYSNMARSLFAPSTLANIAAVPSSYGDLASALLAAKFNDNPQLGFILGGAPALESPVRNLLYGQRMFTAAMRSSISYSFSPRLTFQVEGYGSRSQHVSESSLTSSQNGFLIPNTTAAGASLSVSYSLSPSSQLSGTVTTNRTVSSLFDVYTTTSQVSLGRTLHRRWILQIHGGEGITNPVREFLSASSVPTVQPVTPHPTFGGSLAYKTLSHTFLGEFDRTVSDSYGLGATTSSTGSFTWRWGRPHRSWWLQSGLSWLQMEGGGTLAKTTGWHANTGFGQALGSHVTLLTQFAFLDYTGGLQASTSQFTSNSVRVSVAWSPQPLTAR
jgi:hypothetical protein